MKKYIVRTIVLLCVVTVCAHKAPPLSKDRLNPRLLSVVALNKRQIQFTFSEDIDTLTLKPENVSIFSGEDTLAISILYPSLSASEIVAITEPQSMKEYMVSGLVFDTAQNKGIFRTSFTGSGEPDTIQPWIVRYSQGLKLKEFDLQFSEAMDTSFLTFYVVPKKNMIHVWSNVRSCRIVSATPDDTLNHDTTYYLYINKGCRDLSSNTINPFITSITPDSVYRQLRLIGTVYYNDSLVSSGIALLIRNDPCGIAFVEQGNFSFVVRDSAPFGLEVVSGRYAGSGEVSAVKDNRIQITIQEKSIDSLIR